MTDEMQRFAAKFMAILNSHLSLADQIVPDPAEDNPLFRLYRAYQQPTCEGFERRYHVFAHVLDCVRILDEVSTLLQLSSQNYNLLFLAIAYHDAIYRTDPTEDIKESNEEASAEFARIELEAIGMPEGLIKTVANLILATDHGKRFESSSKLELVIRDIDLAGLARSWKDFDRASDDVRHEYGCVDDESYRHGRAAFMGKILNQRHIYASWELRELWENKARENISRHLSLLQNPGTNK